MRDTILVKGRVSRSPNTFWARRYIRFHGIRHPGELGAKAVEAFLTHLAVKRNVAAATQNQAKSALLFPYKEVLGIELPSLDGYLMRLTGQRVS